jgi:hypothetical protein
MTLAWETTKQVLTLLKNILQIVVIRYNVFDEALLTVSRYYRIATEYPASDRKGKRNRTEPANKGPVVSHVARRGTNGRIHY